MSAAQMRLPGLNPAQQLRPIEDRSAPAFWVRRLRVLSELKAGEEHVVRNVELRRGLNIVWAEHHSAGADNALFRDGVAGHTAGKSTFCRLLRHVLGDGGFAPDGVKRRIRAKLPNAWVTAEVVVGDVWWVVARPLGIGHRSFCLRERSIDDVTDASAERLPYQEFVDELAKGTTETVASKSFPTNDKPVGWQHLLPWLVRDQDCRFADFLEWRHSGSGSEAPAINVEERQFLVRTVLGLISDAERVELQRNAQLVADKEEATRVTPLLRYQAETDRQRLATAFGKELPLTPTPLFGSATRTEIEVRRAALQERTEALKASDRQEELRAALESASSREGALKERLHGVQERLDGVQGVVSELTGTQQSGLLAGLPPPRDFCNVPIRMAHENSCPLAASRPPDLATRRSDRATADELKVQREMAAAIRQVVARLEKEIEDAERATKQVRRDLLSRSTAYMEAQVNLREEATKLDHLQQLIESAETAANNAVARADSIAELTRQLDECYARQANIRDAQRASIQRFSARFDYVVRALIGDQVTGRVDTSGRSLALTIEEHGERDSAAIATVKLLAFDLAAVVASIEGDGAFPRFLVHDGPREADMAPDVYDRLFLLAEQLENCFRGEPAFQYILTTTTTPPEKFVAPGSPWVRLHLSGLSANDRLLRHDL
jgi:hypothetical protein